MKYLTFSYDDGVTQDVRLIELFNKYGMKATFNINSGLLGMPGELIREGVHVLHNKVKPEDVRHIYEGHEVASHTLTHPKLPELDEVGIIKQVEEDRLKLSELSGYEVVGFAYPGGGVNYDSRVSEIIRKNTGIKYCRTTVANFELAKQSNLFEFKPTAHHHVHMDKLFTLGEKFLSLDSKDDAVFYVWGHAYEFDINDSWARFEEFLQMMAGKGDVKYATNKEALLGL